MSERSLPQTESQIVLDVPTEHHSLRVLRLAVADAASSLEFSVDGINRARVALDELAALLISAAGTEQRMVVVITRVGDSVEIDGSVPYTGDSPTVDDMVRELLDLCAGGDSWRLWTDAERLMFRVGVRRA